LHSSESEGKNAILIMCKTLKFQADISGWKEGEDVIYNHVKQGGDRHAQMKFAFEYSDAPHNLELCRFSMMYYHFVLYEAGVPVGDVIEGRIENPNPRRLLPEFKIVYE
jgi:hypothetical protein